MNNLPSVAQITNRIVFGLKRQQFIPVDSGTMRDKAIYYQKIDKNTSCITFDCTKPLNRYGVNYVPYLENGTAPHVITPRFCNYLRFEYNGKIVFAKKVYHTGSHKHDNFISNDSVKYAIDFIIRNYNGKLVK